MTATAEPTTAEKIRALPWSIASNAANTFYVQFTFFGSVFVLFLSELGLSKSGIGLLLSLIPFFGLTALFIAPTIARFGYKRVYVTFFGVRKVITAFLLFTPWILSRFGLQTTLIYVAVVLAIFALVRAVSLTAYYPWIQEYIPNTVRGKYTATDSILSTLTGLLAVWSASFVLGRAVGLNRFMMLIAAGVLFGLLAVWLSSFIPGGAPVRRGEPGGAQPRDLRTVLRDRGFLLYLAGTGLVVLGFGPMRAFLPLYMQEQVGLNSGNVVLLQIGTLIGGLLSSYVWGWAADRYGSKPVMLSGLSLMVLLPVCWLLTPRASAWSLPVALGIAFVAGVATLGWAIGSTRLLFVSVVPPERKTAYMALYYAWSGSLTGLSYLLGGRVLELSAGITGQFLFFPLHAYIPLFLAGLTLLAVSILVLSSIRAEISVGVGEFVGMFLKGNPFRVAASLIRFHHVTDERATVLITERLGETDSPLVRDELLEALADPRFSVRFEAIISIARTRPDPRLTEALVKILFDGHELALAVVAAWALGRIGDERAYEPLCRALDSDYRSIRAHSARALGALGNPDVVSLLLERLEDESDKGLQMAYASALGNLKAREATERLLKLLKTIQNEGARMEVALSLVRIVGEERPFIRLLRQVRADTGTETSLAITRLKRRIDKRQPNRDQIMTVMDDCADVMARGDLARGAALLSRMIRLMPVQRFEGPCALILWGCAARLDEFGATRIEYVILALHIMNLGWQS